MLFDSAHYFFNLYSVPVAIVAAFLTSIGIFILKQNPRSFNNFSFCLICIVTSIWLFGSGIVYLTRTAALATLWYRMFTFFGVSLIAPSIYCFSVSWLEHSKQKNLLIVIGFSLGFLFYLLAVFSPWLVTGSRHYFWGYYPVYGSLSIPFLVFFAVYYLASLHNFIAGVQKEVPGSVKQAQIRLIFLAYFVTFLGSVDYIPKLFNVAIYPFGYLMVAVWLPIVAYSIIRYRLMDIQTVIHKTIMWFAAIAVLIAPFILLFYWSWKWLSRMPAGAFLSFVGLTFVVFSWYSRRIFPWIDHLFQRRKWDLNLMLERFTDELVHLRSLDDVELHILNTVKQIFYVYNTSMLVRKGDSDELVVKQTGYRSQSVSYDMNNDFLKWLAENDMVVIRDYVSIDPRLGHVAEAAKDYFENLGVNICVPMVVNQKLLGVLNIGQKQNLQPFNSVDISFLSDLRRSAAIALSNSLTLIAMQENLRKWNVELEKKVEERTAQLKETQAQLIQAEKMATIGTLAGGVAHEINNPLTAILTNAQILKMDATGDELESLMLIEEGAKRCQEIVKKIMKYARKTMEPDVRTPVDLNSVIDNAIAFIDYQLKQENIGLVIKKEENIPAVQGNLNEFEQILTNLIMNAKDAVRDQARPGEIEVRTVVKGEMAGFIVSDNGHGISKEHLTKIFDPFFTTKDVGKGTGLGLAVTYGIVEKYAGRIDVDSSKGHGTKFSVYFPILK